MAKFELISKYAGQEELLPTRKTFYSAGYDFYVAETTTIPSYTECLSKLDGIDKLRTVSEAADFTKLMGARPTLVPTGIKAKLEPNTYLELSVRSSTPLKTWLILANGVGIIDADYYNNEQNEGAIYFQLINLSPFPIVLHKGDCIGQGIIKQYFRTEDDKVQSEERKGGFGSTDQSK